MSTKKLTLLSSALATVGATSLASYATLSMSTEPDVARLMVKLLCVASYVGLLGVGLFFVGLALPKE